MSAMGEIPDRDRIAADEPRIGALLRAVEAPAPAGADGERSWHRNAPSALVARPRVRADASRRRARQPRWRSCSLPAPAAPTVVRAAEVALAAPTARGARDAHRHRHARSASPTGRRWAGRRRASVSDSVGGRSLTTEFFRSYDAGTLGYTIVVRGAAAVGREPRPAREVSGERYELICERRQREIVTWVQDGHTCILASRTAGRAGDARARRAPSASTAA